MLPPMPRLMRASLGLFVVVLAALAAVASLPEPPPPEWAYESAIALEVGHLFGPHGIYDEGEPVPLERGFQGGQHVNVNLASAELESEEEGQLVAWLVDPSDERVLAGPDRGPTTFYEADTFGELPDDKVYALGRVVVDQPDAVIGHEVELRVELTLSDGRVARAWHRGVGEWLPDDWFVPTDAGVLDDAGDADAGP